MSTTTHRIPVPQELWDAFRKAGSDYMQAKLNCRRLYLLHAADPTSEPAILAGRADVYMMELVAEESAKNIMESACEALAMAETARIMGDAS